MVSVTTTTSPPPLGIFKKRKRDDNNNLGKENSVRIAQTWKSNLLDPQHDLRHQSTPISSLSAYILDAKPRRSSFSTQKLIGNKRHRSTSSTTLALTTTSLPNTPFASPLLNTSPTFQSPNSAGHRPPTRCHICSRPQGITLQITECPICEKGMCQVCTRNCISCELERCSKCCIEESYSYKDMLINRGEEGEPVCLVCLAEYKPDDSSAGSPCNDETDMVQNGH
jgi:hypothetical protein